MDESKKLGARYDQAHRQREFNQKVIFNSHSLQSNFALKKTSGLIKKKGRENVKRK